jgi:putative transposase
VPRVRRIHAPGIVQHVMNRGNRRATIFKDPEDYAAFVRLMLTAGRAFAIRLLAYCLMPNHWHLVVLATEQGAASAYLRWLTGTHVRRYHEAHHLVGTGHLYQGRYTGVPVESDRPLLVVLRYVEANPLRAGLVARAEQWPWSSLGAPAAVRDSLVTDVVGMSRAEWTGWVNARSDEETAALRRAITRGAPFGSTDWTLRTAREFGLEFTMHPRGRPKREPR